ncbi:N-acetylglucosaminyldiphosphoundecaprenol N-acetyl-beta-D-mannosaminyltransferase [Methylobacterium crusticola]|uniref:N-acetylglucosaminyldiphosphoundecaprenol N-acetyl-beta-D-mannosaminyltransferase n=1 Tax=Methylobacterium crusticola TaxID=1697972 RepID=A0ABQ4QRG8_9HYPH|nr:WecB/TagA/CpsF family glycosyltransferase [Methylobacterium crusticola]GJD47480.1 N-acetylglucosaminyldiphosphoundecaprenol N-acetyl-beta-D-mannosaminyltransferase [Methylobacterium crusticola]
MRVELLGLPVDLLSHRETVARALAAMRGEAPRCQHVALNVAKLVTARRDPELDRDVRESDLVGIDGAGIALALRLQGHGRPERVAGIDLFESLMGACAAEGFRPFLLGAKPDVVADAGRALVRRHPGLALAGSHHGYFRPDQEAEICRRIVASGADCLFVALPTPQKERFMHRHRDALGVPFVMGVGGSLDVVAGRVRRAPRLVQIMGAEWAYRLAQEPRRLASRYLRTNAVFAGLLLADAARRLTARRPGAVPRTRT